MSRNDTRTLDSAPEAKTSHSQAETKNAVDEILEPQIHPFLPSYLREGMPNGGTLGWRGTAPPPASGKPGLRNTGLKLFILFQVIIS